MIAVVRRRLVLCLKSGKLGHRDVFVDCLNAMRSGGV
jgi:uncharacterized protein YgbK (DUF1537 family)